jgi:DNA-binding CsgD family transcriptional regulator
MTNDVPISGRELEILRLVATGASNQQIAQQLGISINTVKVHLRNIFSKIGVVSRTEATLYAINNGLVAIDRLVAAPPAPPQLDEQPGLDEIVDRLTAVPPVSAQLDEEPGRIEAVDEIGRGRVVEISDAPAALASISASPTRPAAIPRQKLLLAIGAAVILLILAVAGVQAVRQASGPIPTPIPTIVTATPPSIDPDQRWLTHPPIPNPRDKFALAAYDQGHRLYMIGGIADGRTSAAIDRFDPESNLWAPLTDKPTAVSDASAISLYGNIYMPGGIDANGKVRDILDVFDPREQRWKVGAPLPAPRSRYALVAWEGRLYVIGGWDGAQVRSEVYIYDPQTDSWTEGPALVSPRQNAGAAEASGRIYLIGGSDGKVPLRESLYLDPSAKSSRWEAITPLPQPVEKPGVVTPIGTLLVFDPAQHQGLQYDQVSDSWKTLAIPEDASISSKLALLGGSIFFIGDRSTPISNRVDEYRVIYTVFIPDTGRNSVAP